MKAAKWREMSDDELQQKAQELGAMWQGQSDAQSGEELLSALVRLSTERVVQEALEHEQAEA